MPFFSYYFERLKAIVEMTSYQRELLLKAIAGFNS